MAAHKFLTVGSDGNAIEEAGAISSAGAGDEGKLVALDAGGKIDSTMMPAGLGADSKTMTAGEAISAKDLVYINGSGAAMKADANAVAKRAIGFAQSAISNAATGTITFEGTITGLSGLTPGADYFLSNTTTGAIALYSSLTYGSGDIIQRVGFALSATELSFEPGAPIVKI